MRQPDSKRHVRGTGVVAGFVGLLVLTAAQLGDPSAATTIVKYAPNSAVVISEVSCETDWIEITNTDPKLPANIANWFVADSTPLVPKSSFRFGKAAVLRPGARAVLKASSLPFKIGCGSDTVYLNRNATTIIDRVTVPNLNPGFTWGRVDGRWMANTPTMTKVNVAAPADAVVDRAAWIYDPLKAYAISLTVDSATLQQLVKTPKEYVAAQFQMVGADGTTLPAAGPLQVGVRVKGSIGTLTRASYGPNGLNIVDDKVSLKIKFNFSVKGQTFYGLKKMTLNSMVEDPTMTHETLAYKMFRALGVIAPRTGFANVSINGSLRGLFLNLEPYDEITMAWHIPAMRHVFEGQTTLTGADPVWVNPDFTKRALDAAFFVDEGSTADRADLEALIAGMQAAISAEPDSVTLTPRAMPTSLTSHLDVEELGRFFAAEKFMNHFDGYSGSVPWAPNNFYLVDDPQGRFQFMPWGTDVTWRLVPGEEGLDVNGRQPFDRGTAIAFRVCLRDDRCASAYRVGLATAATLAPSWKAFAEQLLTLHEPSRLADTVRRTTELDVASQWSRMRDFFPDQVSVTQDYLKTVVTGAVRWQPVTNKLAKGTAFSAQQLNAYSDVAGTFSYSVALGTKLAVGKYNVTVTFTPAAGTSPAQTATQTFTVG